MPVSGVPSAITWTGPRRVNRSIIPPIALASCTHRGCMNPGVHPPFYQHQQRRQEMQARMKNPAMILPGAMRPIQEVIKAAQSGGVEEELLELIHLRVSQINGCSFCVDAGLK